MSEQPSIHLSDEQLVAWADGELDAFSREEAAGHLAGCEQCRRREALLSGAFADFAAYRRDVLASEAAPASPRVFEKVPPPAVPIRRRPGFCAIPGRYWRIAAGIAAALLIVILSQRQPSQSPTGGELLSRAMAADLSVVQAVVRPVYYQKLRMRRSGESKDVETWSRQDRFRLAHKGGERVWDEITRVWADNGLGTGRPLSPAAFRNWSGSLGPKTETVAPAELEGGAGAWKITARAGGAVPAGRLVEASLLVRKTDWHPVRQTLRVQGEGEVRELEVMELAFQVVPADALGPEVLSLLQFTLPAPAEPAARESQAAAVPAWDPDKAEIEALMALHRVQACKGEPIQIRRAGQSLEIHGVVDSAGRKVEVVGALRGIPGLHLDIRSAEEHLRQSPGSPAPAVETPQTPGGPAGGDDWQGKLPPELLDVANRAVSLADDALIEAWALRRLAEAFPEDRMERLAPESRGVLETMLRDHAAALHRNLAETRSLLASVAPAPGPGSAAALRSEWPAAVQSLFAAVEQERGSVRELFANLGGAGREQAAARFAEANAAAQRGAAQLERNALLAPSEGSTTGQNRR
jgi:hypothetical protein